MKKNTLAVQQYFTSNGKTDILYFTADGLAFFNESNANAHAASLAKKNPKLGGITPITRAEAMAVDPAPVAVVITQDMLDADPTLTTRGFKLGDTLEEIKTEVDAVAEAQKVFNDATAGGDAPTIAAAKTALTNAKAKATRDAKKK